MSDKFKAEYKVKEVCLKTFEVLPDEINGEIGEEELKELYEDLVQENFLQYVKPTYLNLDEFKAWAKDVLAKKALAKKVQAAKD